MYCSFLISRTSNDNSSKSLVRIVVEVVQVEATAIFVLQVLHLYYRERIQAHSSG